MTMTPGNFQFGRSLQRSSSGLGNPLNLIYFTQGGRLAAQVCMSIGLVNWIRPGGKPDALPCSPT